MMLWEGLPEWSGQRSTTNSSKVMQVSVQMSQTARSSRLYPEKVRFNEMVRRLSEAVSTQMSHWCCRGDLPLSLLLSFSHKHAGAPSRFGVLVWNELKFSQAFWRTDLHFHQSCSICCSPPHFQFAITQMVVSQIVWWLSAVARQQV